MSLVSANVTSQSCPKLLASKLQSLLLERNFILRLVLWLIASAKQANSNSNSNIPRVFMSLDYFLPLRVPRPLMKNSFARQQSFKKHSRNIRHSAFMFPQCSPVLPLRGIRAYEQLQIFSSTSK